MMVTAPHASIPAMVRAGQERLPGVLTVPPEPTGLVIFAHGSQSSRHSTRNQFVSEILVNAGFATLLFDLLTDPEGLDRAKVFDIPLLAERLKQATAWAAGRPETTGLPIGYFGASTGAGAALAAAADFPTIRAVVSRGGRPDLALDQLSGVHAATLLIVGGEDHPVLALNRAALARLPGNKRLVVLPGASHLFPEAGALETVARMATRWFGRFLAPARPLALTALSPGDPYEAENSLDRRALDV